MGATFLRALVLLLLIGLLIFSIPASRARLLSALREKRFAELKQALKIALILYFLLSLAVTLYRFIQSD